MQKVIQTVLLILLVVLIFVSKTHLMANNQPISGFDKKQPVRSVVLTKIFEIKDDAGEFLFKYPNDIKIAPDGSIFVQEWRKLYHFDSKGNYIRNYFTFGEGPGELKLLSSFYFYEDTLVVVGAMPLTILKFDYKTGQLRSEFRDRKAPFLPEMIYGNKKGIIISSGDESEEHPSIDGVFYKVNNFEFYDSTHKQSGLDLKFKTEDVVVTTQGAKGAKNIYPGVVTDLKFVSDKNRYIYLAHTRRYLVKQIDLGKRKVIKEFKGQYDPVPYKSRKYKYKWRQKMQTQSGLNYFLDIYALGVYKEKLMVFTSTLDKNKGVMVDVFNSDGEYTDCVYIKLPGVKRPDDLLYKPIRFEKNFLWTTYKDEEGNPVVVKYSLTWK